MSDAQLEGILIPLPVSFHEDGRVDEGALDVLVDFYVSAGVHGFFALGTHGQGMVLEIAEREKVAEQIVRRVNGRVPVVLHVGTANTFSTIGLAQHAAQLGMRTLGIVPPYYYPHDEYEIFVHYQRVMEAVPDSSLFIYENLETTKIHLTPLQVVKLLERVPDICGIKVTGGGFEPLIEYVRRLPATVGVFPGSVIPLYPGYSLGVRGAIPPNTSPFPEICVKLYEALKSRNLAEAETIHNKIVALNGLLNRYRRAHGRGVQFEAMRLRGLPIVRFPRWECAPFTERERGEFRGALEDLGIDLSRP